MKKVWHFFMSLVLILSSSFISGCNSNKININIINSNNSTLSISRLEKYNNQNNTRVIKDNFTNADIGYIEFFNVQSENENTLSFKKSKLNKADNVYNINMTIKVISTYVDNELIELYVKNKEKGTFVIVELGKESEQISAHIKNESTQGKFTVFEVVYSNYFNELEYDIYLYEV